MKKIIIGIIIGMMISTTAAAVTKEYILTPITYNITANGKSLLDTETPPLNYKGTTYLSLKKTAEVVGANLNWNTQTKTAELNTSGGEPVIIEKGSNISFKAIENEEMYQYHYKSDKTRYIIKDNIVYVKVNLFYDYFDFNTGTRKMIINYPKDNSLIIENIDNDINALVYSNKIYIKLTALGLNYKLENDTLIIE